MMLADNADVVGTAWIVFTPSLVGEVLDLIGTALQQFAAAKDGAETEVTS
jgi:hypothetical protein